MPKSQQLKRLAVNAKVATVLGYDHSILRHSGIRGAADEAVLNNIHKNKKAKESPFKVIRLINSLTKVMS